MRSNVITDGTPLQYPLSKWKLKNVALRQRCPAEGLGWEDLNSEDDIVQRKSY